MLDWLNPITLIQSFGVLGIWLIVFAESGLLFGFFLPGDSLLFSAGLLAASGYLPIGWLVIGSLVAAVLGDSTGYLIGQRIGNRLWLRPDSRWFRREYLERTKHFYERYGQKTIILARFVPIVRTFAPVLAGVGRMRYREFLSFNIIGGVMWGAGLPTLGYWLGRVVPAAQTYLHLIIVAIIIISFIPIIIEYWRQRRSSSQTGSSL